MAYEKHDWTPGEIITEELLDHMEQGIADANGAAGGAGELADGSVTKAKLAEDVQASLGKADTALQAAPTTIPQGALVPGAGIDLTRGEGDVLTCAVKAKGVTAAMLADGVLPEAYVLPAATAASLGGVKQAAAVADLAADAPAADIVKGVNAILASMRASGSMAAPATK